MSKGDKRMIYVYLILAVLVILTIVFFRDSVFGLDNDNETSAYLSDNNVLN